MKHKPRLLPMGVAIVLLCLSACTTYAAELQLAGIKLGRSALTVMHVYGNPTSIELGARATSNVVAPNFVPLAPSATSSMGFPMMSSAPQVSPFEDIGLSSGSPFAMPQMGTVVAQKTTSPEVVWIYDYYPKKSKQLRFTINPDGLVVQIAAFGVDWPSIRTSKGIGLGNTYKEVLFKYGFPESHEQSSLGLGGQGGIPVPITNIKYPEKHRVIFTLVGINVVGITVALMD